MGTQVYEDGVLVEEWDDTTRQYTDHRLPMAPGENPRDYNEEENAAADEAAAAAATISDLAARVEALEAWRASLELVDPEADPDQVADWPSVSDYLHAVDAVLPGALVRFPAGDGLVYRNGSTLPLVHSPALIPPEAFPNLWQRVATSHDPDEPGEPGPEPGEYAEWEPYVDYAVGDRRTFEGRLYECKAPLTNSPPNWQPPVAHGYWTDLGPWPPTG